VAGPQGFIGEPDELTPILGYLRSYGEIREILVSGGDPLTAADHTLARLFSALRDTRPDLLLRVCTRVPITDPARLGLGTIELFRRYRPLRLSVHINHPRELALITRTNLAACVAAGIPVLVQTVLLRGINDEPETLAELFRKCLALGLNPYYLFQLDLAPGTAHFRVPLKRGLALYEKLRDLLPPSGLPAYAVDLPGGGGKVRLNEGLIAGEETVQRGAYRGRAYLLRGPDGKLWPYPADLDP
jgi:lysine 2,3-aminomutase